MDLDINNFDIDTVKSKMKELGVTPRMLSKGLNCDEGYIRRVLNEDLKLVSFRKSSIYYYLKNEEMRQNNKEIVKAAIKDKMSGIIDKL